VRPFNTHLALQIFTLLATFVHRSAKERAIRLPVGVEQFKRIVLINFESQANGVLDCHIGEGSKDLLKRSLADGVFADLAFLLHVFDLAEEPPNSLIFPGNSKLKEVTALFNQVDLREQRSQLFDVVYSMAHREQEVDQITESHLPIVARSFESQVTT
jgi:hypothetical protein